MSDKEQGTKNKKKGGRIPTTHGPVYLSLFTCRSSHGFTLIELLIVLAMILIGGAVVGTANRDLFSFNAFFDEALTAQRAMEALLSRMVREIRAAAPASTGAYALEKTDPNSLAFYANIDGDATVERVQYFRSGTDVIRSVVDPTGSPLTYATSTAAEILETVLRDTVASTTASLFSYWSGAYAGTSTPLVPPVSPVTVRHVRITLIVDRDPARLPPELVGSSAVTIRNLKDNY